LWQGINLFFLFLLGDLIPTTDKLVVKDNYASYDDKGVIVQVTDMNGEKTDNYYACHLIIVKQI